MPQETFEDSDDVFAENLITSFFMLLGILAVSSSMFLLGYLTIEAVYSQQLSPSLMPSLIVAASFLAVGLGAVHFFRRRRELRKKKAESLFWTR